MANIEKKIKSKLSDIFTQFAQTSAEIFWIRAVDSDTFYFINDAFSTLWGYSLAELKANPDIWMQSVIIEDRELYRQYLLHLHQAHESLVSSINYRIIRRCGAKVYLHETSTPVFDGRKCIAFVGCTYRLMEEPALGRDDYAQKFFRFFIEKSDAVFWVSGFNDKSTLYVNPAYEKIWGRSCDSLLINPASWYEAVHEDDRDKISPKKLMNAASLSTPPVATRFRIRRPAGDIRWIREKNFPIRSELGELIGCAGIAEDITEDVRWEAELQQAKMHAEAANKAKSDFLAMMSHELRTPLNAILGMTQILEQSPLAREQIAQLDVIKQSGSNLLSLLNEILDFTKIENGNFKLTKERIDLHALVHRLIAEMEVQAKNKALTLDHRIDKDVARFIMGDHKRLHQVLSNLLANAIKYTRQGFVCLKVTRLQQNNRETTLCFTVEDSGIGIEKSKLDSIFCRFQQIESVYQRKHDGVGLGLAIVKELVERMGGDISVSSELSVGSQFSCILPFELDSLGAVPYAFPTTDLPIVSEDNAPNQHFDMRVLVVEDNKINQKISKTMLEQMGCQVELAENAMEALNRDLGDFDVIFMDIGLPDMDGFQATERIRARESGYRVPIVAMTAHVFAHDQERCFKVGMDEVVAKPIMREDLMAVLTRWCKVVHT